MNEADLHAYVDGQLSEERRAEVDAWLAGHAEDAARVHAYLAQNHALRRRYAGIAAEPLPPRLAQWLTPRPRRWLPFSSLGRIAASMALVGLGVLIGWQLAPEHTSPAPESDASLPRQAAVAHVVYSPDVRRPVEIGADQEEQLVTWLSKRIGTPVRPPRLGELGFELIGGRLLPGAQGPVAQFMYHDASGQRLTLYVSTENTANQETAFRFAQEGPVNVYYWIDGRFGYALSAGIEKERLARLAAAVHAQLTQQP